MKGLHHSPIAFNQAVYGHRNPLTIFLPSNTVTISTMPSSIETSFLGALQASLSVLLTISYGVIAGQFNLLSNASVKDVSKICVRMFLPALLITNVGSELHLDTGLRYVPILSVFPQVYHFLKLWI